MPGSLAPLNTSLPLGLGERWQDLGPYGYNWLGLGQSDPGLANGSLGLGGGVFGQTPYSTDYDPPTKKSEVISQSHMVAIGDASFITVAGYNPIIGDIDLEFSEGANEIAGYFPPGLGPMILAKRSGMKGSEETLSSTTDMWSALHLCNCSIIITIM
jgi:hypothetical protein